MGLTPKVSKRSHSVAPTLTSDTGWVTEMLKLKSCAGSLLEGCHLLPVTLPASFWEEAGRSVSPVVDCDKTGSRCRARQQRWWPRCGCCNSSSFFFFLFFLNRTGHHFLFVSRAKISRRRMSSTSTLVKHSRTFFSLLWVNAIFDAWIDLIPESDIIIIHPIYRVYCSGLRYGRKILVK